MAKKQQSTISAADIYAKARQDLTERHLFEEVDHELLEAYAKEMADYYRLKAEIEKEGEAVDTGTGSVKSNPKLLRMDGALKNAMNLAKMLGISAISRKAVNSGAKKAKSATLSLIKRAK